MPKALRVVTLEEAHAKLRKYWQPRAKASVAPLDQAPGRVLFEDVSAEIDLPPFDRASFDGYAVVAADTFGAGEESPVTLACVGKVRAGEWPELKVGRGECAEIATGAPIPEEADAVVMVEHTVAEGGLVKVYRAVAPGENVAKRGSEIRRGEKVLEAGQVVTPQVLGTLAAIGVKEVKLYSQPSVAVISTGLELVEAGQELGPGKIYDVNGPALCEAVRLCGCRPTYLGIAADDPAGVMRLVEEGLASADVVVISGGSSAGAGDMVPAAVNSLGEPGVIIHGLALKPGKPTFVALVRGKPVFGLPGYPVSALMVFDKLVAPYLRSMSGLGERSPTTISARMTRRILSAKGRRELAPVKLIRKDGEVLAEPILKGSGAITALSMADGYIDVPLEQEIVDKGELVKANLFGVR